MRKIFLYPGALLALSLAGCETPGQSGMRAARLAQRNAIYSEPQGDYFIGRRYYNPNYKFWGYIRRPGQPWKTAKLVMLDEKDPSGGTEHYAPDRLENAIGSDNNAEYRIYGHFTEGDIYEPASNHMYPGFVATGFTLLNRTPPSIFDPGTQLPSTVVMQPD